MSGTFSGCQDSLPVLSSSPEGNFFQSPTTVCSLPGTALADLQGRLLAVDSGFNALARRKSAELIGTPYASLFSSEETAAEHTWWEQVRTGASGENEGERHLVFHSESSVVHQRATVLHDAAGQPAFLSIFWEDPRAREYAEQWFTLLTQAVPEVLWIASADGMWRYVNDRWTEYTGQVQEKSLGMSWLSAIHPDDQVATRSIWDRAVQSGTAYHATFRLQGFTGSWRWYQTRGVPFCDLENRVTHWFGVAMDIEEQKRSAAALERSNQELQQFAYAISHDLREPLRAVSSFLELLASRYQDDLKPEAREFISFALSGARRLNRMIIDLLQYSRAAAQPLQPATVSMEQVITEALSNLQQLIQEADAVIECDPLPEVPGEVSRLVQVMQNLIHNAILYRRPSTPPVVRISAKRTGSNWLFTVTDNGIGIEPAQQDRIFSVFKRLHGQELPGTGMGLALCRRIIERHGGRIWAQSVPGEGSTFYFTLPAYWLSQLDSV